MSATVLPFPQTAKALRRRRTGMGAAGYLALLLMEKGDEEVPANVQRFDEPDGELLPSQSPELLLAMLMFAQLPKSRKENVKRSVRCMAYSGRPSPFVIQLHNTLKKL